MQGDAANFRFWVLFRPYEGLVQAFLPTFPSFFAVGPDRESARLNAEAALPSHLEELALTGGFVPEKDDSTTVDELPGSSFVEVSAARFPEASSRAFMRQVWARIYGL